MAERFTLDRDGAREWLTRPPRAAQGPGAPQVFTLEVPADWNPGEPGEDYLLDVLVESAQYRTGAAPVPVVSGPPGALVQVLTLGDEEGGQVAYVVTLTPQGGPTLRLVSEATPLADLVADQVRGVEAALVTLTDAVDVANACLRDLEGYIASRSGVTG